MYALVVSDGTFYGPFDDESDATQHASMTLDDVTWTIVPLIEPDTRSYTDPGFRPQDPECPFTMSHTRYVCGYAGCGDY